MTLKISLRGNATPSPHPLRAVTRTSAASLTTLITCSLAPVRAPHITHGLETRMEIKARASISRMLHTLYPG